MPYASTIPKEARLQPAAWQGLEEQLSLPFQTIATASPVASYYSTVAQNMCTRDADLQMLRDAVALPSTFKNVRAAWLGELVDAKHMFCFEMLSPSSGVRAWYMAGSHFPDSSVLDLEVLRHAVPGHAGEYWFELVPIDGCKLVSIFNLAEDNITCCSVRWCYWLSQYMQFPRARGKLPPAIRLLQVGKVEPVRKLAARCGFWSMCRTFVLKFAKYLQIGVDCDSSHCSQVAQVCSGILDCSQEDALQRCHQRLACMAETRI